MLDHIAVIGRSLAQISADQAKTIEILIRADSAGGDAPDAPAEPEASDDTETEAASDAATSDD